jgi:hypothetical protein
LFQLAVYFGSEAGATVEVVVPPYFMTFGRKALGEVPCSVHIFSGIAKKDLGHDAPNPVLTLG